MSGLGSWLWGTSQLDDAVDKATSDLLPAGAEDIALNLEICDQIRSKSVPAKDAMRALKRRLNHKNPNVQNLALGLTDICIKNGGDLFLSEVASREFMDNLVSILKVPGLNNDVKQNILRLVQNWSIAFEGKPPLFYVGQVYKTLLNEGYNFPPKDLAVANSAMVDTQIAPEWIDSDVCLRCRTAFTFTNRKHHCRNCGSVFDQACSSKSMALPHFGITQEVRVCDGCYNKITRKADKADKGHRHSASMHSTRHRSARELADAELQRAIQLSLQEVGAANGHARPGYVPAQPSDWQYSEPPIIDRSSHPKATSSINEEEDDPDLRAAIEASLREANAPQPSAPVALESPRTEYSGPGYSQSYPPSVAQVPALPSIPTYDLEPLESDAILTFSQTIDQVEAQGGRDISRYPAVNELFEKASSLRPKLALSLDDAGRKEQMLTDMHDKLSQAVKLYDQLLTEQLAQPRWRSPQVTNQYQPAESSYNTVNSYSQWASSGPATTSAYQPQPELSQPSQPPQASYSEYQPQYAPGQQPQWHQQPAQHIHYSPTPAAPLSPPQSPPEPQRRQSQYAEHAQYQSYASPNPPQTQALPPVTLNPHQYQTSTASPLSYQTSPPTQVQSQYAASPPPPPQQRQPQHQQPQHSASPPAASNLTRHHTVSYAASPLAPAPPPANTGHLGRSNTVASHFRPRQHQQQAPGVVTPPSALPQFPVAPTSAPQTFNMYSPSISSGFAPPEERKEALLIDL
ncbi:hypothetical protein D9615_007208 [Tricholomella constricta]|uniref:Vacuolar protein sorting-associated protein 27 n=1 Tax=Tricholomella constricta TaxID=117010 RepID=A0A8H5H556_9AGAR|nr:hypothetical protein D9615_007208 [Tricholomella constricta]